MGFVVLATSPCHPGIMSIWDLHVACCRCPGVFKTAQTSCGEALLPVVESFTLENGQSRIAYWQCGNRECHFKEFLHDRLIKPQVALEAISAEEGFKVQRSSFWLSSA